MAFFYSQLFVTPPAPTTPCTGKTVIITGGNTGLGKEAARHFVRLGAKTTILAVRNVDKGHVAKHDIDVTTHCAPNAVKVWELDMASYASVQAFAARVNSALDRVDIFVANAGIAPANYTVAEDNEASITVNVVSTFLLAALVMPQLNRTATTFHTQPTFTIVSSDVHGHTKLPQKSAGHGKILVAISDKQTAEKHWSEQYPISKLLQVLGVRAIAEKRSASRVTVNCVNPGLCHSELGRDFPGLGFWLIKLVLARSTEVGSRTLVHAGSQGAESHGKYLSDCELSTPAPFVLSADGATAQARVWAELLGRLDVIVPGVSSNL